MIMIDRDEAKIGNLKSTMFKPSNRGLKTIAVSESVNANARATPPPYDNTLYFVKHKSLHQADPDPDATVAIALGASTAFPFSSPFAFCSFFAASAFNGFCGS
jgi:hypothetical protein